MSFCQRQLKGGLIRLGVSGFLINIISKWLIPLHGHAKFICTVAKLLATAATHGWREGGQSIASTPGAFVTQILSHSRTYSLIFLHGCEIKSGQGSPGFEARQSIA